jgi:DNA processing protein
MVGSRNPTHNGLETAKRFARYFSDQGLTITSGMATGIDTACHRGALVGTARTIAVLGSGPDVIFPQSNDLLAQSIIAEGLLISEYPPGTPARSIHFPQRNRIIAGLSVGTMVVEAAHRSGSLITARLAGEYGREIFAIPGSIHSPLAKGCHRLIKDGAKLVENAADVLVELSSLLQFVATNDIPEEREKTAPHSLTEQPGYSELLDAMDFSPSAIGNISARAGLTTAEVSSMLLLLELEGFVEALPGGLYSRLPKRSA